jgi:hypothetical protein
MSRDGSSACRARKRGRRATYRVESQSCPGRDMVKTVFDGLRSRVADSNLVLEESELGVVQSEFRRGDEDVGEDGSVDVEEAGSVK